MVISKELNDSIEITVEKLRNKEVVIILDKDLVDNKLLCHPNTNTKTVSIEYKDLIRLIEYNGTKYIIY